MATGGTYQRLRDVCLSEFFRRVRLREEFFKGSAEEDLVKELQGCAESFLDRYAKLRAEEMDSRELEDFYKDTVLAFERVLGAKMLLYDMGRSELERARVELKSKEEKVCSTDSEEFDEGECRAVREQLEEVDRAYRQLELAEKEDIFVIKTRLKACSVADNPHKKALCVESLADMLEVRWDILPLMCGVPPSEFVGRFVVGKGLVTADSDVVSVSRDVAEDVQNAIRCLRNIE